VKRDREAVALVAGTALIPSWVIAASVWGGLSLICLVLTLWFALEAATYVLHEPQITPYVRSYVSHRPTVAFIGCLVLVVLAVAAAVHFWLDR